MLNLNLLRLEATTITNIHTQSVLTFVDIIFLLLLAMKNTLSYTK